MHEDQESKVQHQICKDCFLGSIQFKNYNCPICKSDLEITEKIMQAIKTIVDL